jgi:hypothetical protein
MKTPQKMKVQFFFRKIRNQLAVQADIFVEREDGSSHSKKFIIHNADIDKAKRIAKSQAEMFLRNITKNANVVEL